MTHLSSYVDQESGPMGVSGGLGHAIKFGRLITGIKHCVLLLLAIATNSAFAQEEISLFDGRGQASAYIVADNDLTIYLWSGKPVAYLVRDSGRDFHVYGFNGKHLGWFVRGILRDDQGDAACAVKEVISTTAQIEPLKSLKSLQPLKSLRELAPLRPLFSNQWGELPCRFVLGRGE